MKSPKSIVFIVVISLLVGGLQLFIGPNYSGWGRVFVGGYLMDILLPFNLFLLFQIPLRKRLSVSASRGLSAGTVAAIGLTTELAQYFHWHLFGTTFDPWDLLMYAIGICMGWMVDHALIHNWEHQASAAAASDTL